VTPVRFAYPVQIGLLAGLYFVLAEVGLSAGSLTGNVTPVWPPTGLALAALVLFGRRLWPGVALGALLVNGLSDVPLVVAGCMAVGNTLEALIGATLLRLIPGFHPSLGRVADVVSVAVLAAGLSTAIGASVGVVSLALGGVIAPGAFWATWRVWWVGDALGALVVAPVILTWARPGPFGVTGRARIGALVGVVGLTCVTLVAFSSAVDRPYLAFPGLIGAALLLRQPGATAATLVVSGVAVALTVEQIGPFVTASTIDSLWTLDIFLAVAALTTMLLAAVVSERDRAGLEARILAQQLRHLADTDPLTGLRNRRSFDSELERQVAQVARYGPGGALLVLDLDHLKQVNDTQGHRAGDEIITSVTDVLRRRLRDTDIISRLGGDEFGVILPRATQAEAGQVADALVEAVRGHVPVSPGKHARRMTVSVGVAMFDTPGLSGKDMLLRADRAMYHAKQAGRDRSASDRSRPEHHAGPPARRGH
jgi:diguanylate cyclase (GGDEF)-like protein